MTGTCICGAVRVTVESKPEFIHDCNCSVCSKAGAAWGYYTSKDVCTTGRSAHFMRKDKDNPSAQIHACEICHATTHFVMAPSYTDKFGPLDMIGVNMRLFDPKDLDGVEIRFPDGQAWSGEGPFNYRRTSVTMDAASAW